MNRIPNLVIEVVSSNRTYDRVAKRAIYGSAGVQEYWLIDIVNDHVEVCYADALSSARIELVQLQTTLLPGFVLDVQALFANA